MKKIRFTALCLALALSVGLLAGCGDPAENSFDDATATNSSMDGTSENNDVLIADSVTVNQSFDDDTTVEESVDESEESPLSTDESEREETSETSESADSATSRPDDESEPAEEISADKSSAPSEKSKEPSSEQSKTESTSSETFDKTSQNDETDKQNPSNTGSSHKHSYRDTLVKPTCMEGGYLLHTCSCGYSYKDQETEKVDHDFNHYVERIDPTDTTRGKGIIGCLYNCGATRTEEYYSYNEVAEMLRPRVLYWINYYRKEAGVSEAAMSETFNPYAQYRAAQLVTNYAHDRDDQRVAANATHTGTLYESTQVWPETGWESGAGELISRDGPVLFTINKDDLDERIEVNAKWIVNGFYNSPRHKAIMLIETDEQMFFGFGTYRGYVCISVTGAHQEDSYIYWYEDAEGNLYHAWVSYKTGYFSPYDDDYYPPSEKYDERFRIEVTWEF